jgi:hypothetical protein
MKNHFLLLVLFSIPVSFVLAFITKDGMRERRRYFLYLLASFILISIVASWVMYLFPF